MVEVRRVGSDDDAEALAALLNGHERTRPTVVVTIPAQSATPYIDAGKIAAELGELAEVYLIETGPHTWTFSQKMADQTQVYGGAGRVYPLGHDWVTDVRRSPLRFAFDPGEGERATGQLIEDGLDMASLAGLIGGAAATTGRRRAAGVVQGLMSERALVRTDAGPLLVPPQLAAPDIPIERVLAKGMRVSGWYDEQTRWFDVRESQLDASEALAAYRPGDTVLALVTEIGADAATAQLHPEVSITLPRAAVTPDESADLRGLFSRDEVIRVVLLETAPRWAASLTGAAEEAAPAAALYPSGPPWLVEADEPPVPYEPVAPLPMAPAPPAPPPPEPASALVVEVAPDSVRSVPLSPLAMPRRRGDTAPVPAPAAATPTTPTPATPVPSSSSAIGSLSLKVAELQARVADLEARLEATEHERRQLIGLRQDDTATINRQETQLRQLRKKVRTAGSSSASPAPAPLQFADRERGFRYQVLTAWARRTPLAEQPHRPLPDFAIGAAFIDSLDEVQGVSESKVADVVFEVVTGLAERLHGRDVHQLRTGAGGDDPAQHRGDGAVCWRAALQQGTASARRLHYWRLPDSTIELSRVVLHDDMDP